MNFIFCVDDNYGMMFNSRRQSKDIKVINNILNFSKDYTLNIDPYSLDQFSKFNLENINVSKDFLKNIKDNNFYFVENQSIELIKDKIKKITLFKWNRIYPADFYFNKSILINYNLLNIYEFTGNSHEKITREDWYLNE